MKISAGKSLKSRRKKLGKVTSHREKIGKKSGKVALPPRKISLLRPWQALK